MPQRIAQVALLVRDYDEALGFYIQKLGFALLEDSPMGEGKRWVVVAPPGERGCRLLLARAASPRQLDALGNQSGGRVFLFIDTDDFWRDYRAYQAAGVRFIDEPREEAFGTRVIFEDLYGNQFDLVQRKAPPAA